MTTLAFALVAPAANAVSFLPLGDLPGGRYDSKALGVSGDGRVVVGQGWSDTGRHAFRWTADGEMVELGTPPESVRAIATSFDGSVVVATLSFIESGFRWTENEGVTELPIQPYAVSADGRVAVGAGPYLWTADSGSVRVPLPRGALWDGGFATAVSEDGSVIGGYGIIVNGGVPFYWTEESGPQFLNTEALGHAFVADMSADGSVIVGSNGGRFASTWEGGVFRWTEAVGEVTLEHPEVVYLHGASAVSADGSIIVGASSYHDAFELAHWDALIWDEDQGWRQIEQILIDSGIDLTGWDLSLAYDVSADGTVVVGAGVNPDGNEEAWLADLSHPTLLPGDYDGNLVVDQGDLDLVLLNWGDMAPGSRVDAPDGWIRNVPTGLIDQEELDGVLLNWGAVQVTPSAAAGVPEPNVLVLAWIAVLTWVGPCSWIRNSAKL